MKIDEPKTPFVHGTNLAPVGDEDSEFLCILSHMTCFLTPFFFFLADPHVHPQTLIWTAKTSLAQPVHPRHPPPLDVALLLNSLLPIPVLTLAELILKFHQQSGLTNSTRRELAIAREARVDPRVFHSQSRPAVVVPAAVQRARLTNEMEFDRRWRRGTWTWTWMSTTMEWSRRRSLIRKVSALPTSQTSLAFSRFN